MLSAEPKGSPLCGPGAREPGGLESVSRSSPVTCQPVPSFPVCNGPHLTPCQAGHPGHSRVPLVTSRASSMPIPLSTLPGLARMDPFSRQRALSGPPHPLLPASSEAPLERTPPPRLGHLLSYCLKAEDLESSLARSRDPPGLGRSELLMERVWTDVRGSACLVNFQRMMALLVHKHFE